jgi:RsiW-degrading membrane proteinase PrsW (M82 family)
MIFIIMRVFYLFILCLLPSLIYSFIIYVSAPYKTISFKKGINYLLGGSAGTVFLLMFLNSFPYWSGMSALIFNPITDPLEYLHFKNFIEIALLEESLKFLVFILVTKINYNKETDHPIGIMFYACMVSLGFAFIENIIYGINSKNPENVLIWRSITSVIGHMIFGLFMGYWIAIGKLGIRLRNRSLLDILVLKNTQVRQKFFGFIALISATIIHGMYDLELDINGEKGIVTIYIILLTLSFLCFLSSIHVNNLYIHRNGQKKKTKTKSKEK